MPSVARANRTLAVAATTAGTKAVATTTTTWVPTASASQKTLSRLSITLGRRTPEPQHPHDKKGKKKNNGGNDDFQEPDKTVNILFGGLPSRREQKATVEKS
jgi:hypothetical protein